MIGVVDFVVVGVKELVMVFLVEKALVVCSLASVGLGAAVGNTGMV